MTLESSHGTRAVAVVILSVVFLGGLTAYVAPVSPHQANDTGGTAEGIRSVVNANNRFALELYSNIKGDNRGGNIFYSPLSIFLALAMTYEGARGQTASEIQSVFHFPEDNATRRSSIAAICNDLNKVGVNYTLSIANALWVQKDYQLLDEYVNVIRSYYAGEATNVDFVKATEQARQTINAWVENRTSNRITNLIPEGALNQFTRLVLTNAIYFNGTWVKPFDGGHTTESDFRVNGSRTVKVPMMSQTGPEAIFNYAKVDNVQLLEMPYNGGNLSMLILLPKSDDLSSFEEALTLEKLNQWRNELSEQRVDVYVPKFNFTTQYQLSKNLIEMGMPTVFSEDTAADFSGMDGTRNLFIGDVLHKAFIGVNENGTEAAAATAVVMVGSALPVSPVTIFRADHPFMFMIQERVTGNILFLGRVINPTQ